MTRNRNVELATVIGKGTKITGTLKVEGGVRVDGEIDGELVSNGFVTIGATGVATANIKAQECMIAGKVIGNVTVEEALELDKTANLEGDLIAKVIKITAGALFNGNSTMGKKMNSSKQQTFFPKKEVTDNKSDKSEQTK
ncbi:MAG: polymer-forming cytoskeletal protein [Candidatus Cloacimonetes bacterium]|nr:polymer-forming cytoskeletal protein [Candidatus Cloacimonadota bacterium]